MKTKKTNLWYFAGPVAFVIVVWGLGWLNKNPFDIFNAITALFSGLAFAGLIYTIYQQQVELALQRQELADTREELRGQKEQLSLQNEHFAQQNFETTLFNMLATQRQIIDEIEYTSWDGPYKGRQYFEHIHESFWILYKILLIGPENNNFEHLYHTLINKENLFQVLNKLLSSKIIISKLDIKSFEKKYDQDFKSKCDLCLSDIKQVINNREWTMLVKELINSKFMVIHEHYFKHLYRILRFIKENEEKEIWKGQQVYSKYQNYADILKSQLSTVELFMIFYSALNHPNTMKLLEHYFILNSIDKDILLDPSHIVFYNFKKES